MFTGFLDIITHYLLLGILAGVAKIFFEDESMFQLSPVMIT